VLVALALAPAAVAAEKELGLVMDHNTKEKLLKPQGSNHQGAQRNQDGHCKRR